MPAVLPDGLDDRRHAAARGSARRLRAAGRRAPGDVAAALAAPGPTAAHRHEQRQAHRAAASAFPAPSSRRSAATSTRGCASSMRESTTRWCSPRPACAGSASATASRRSIPPRRLRAGAGPGHHRDRRFEPTTNACRRALQRGARRRGGGGARCGTGGRGGARRRLPAAARRPRHDHAARRLELQAVVCSPDGARDRPRPGQRARRRPAGARRRVAGQLSRDGAGEILDEVAATGLSRGSRGSRSWHAVRGRLRLPTRARTARGSFG